MTSGIRTRLARCDWAAVGQRLDEAGSASLGVLLGARECSALARLYVEERRFRSTIDMARHRFGEGQYRYFAAPLPELVAELREAAYVHLAPLANRWMKRLARAERFPERLDAFLAQCHARGQTRPTPLLLRYAAGGFNCLHHGRAASRAARRSRCARARRSSSPIASARSRARVATTASSCGTG
jgi:hypothetical protein